MWSTTEQHTELGSPGVVDHRAAHRAWEPRCREDLFKDMMSEREDVASKRARCMAAQGAFREALAALEVLPQQLVTLTSRASQPLPPDLAWSEAAHNAKRAAGPAGGSMFS